MNKGVVPQETKDEKTISRSGWKRTFNLVVKDSNYLGKMTRMEGSQKSWKSEEDQIAKISSLKGSWNGKSASDFQLGRTKRKKLWEKKEKTSPWATVTTRALRGKKGKSLVLQNPRNTLKKEEKTHFKGIRFLRGRIP